jgi:hypothetical protein
MDKTEWKLQYSESGSPTFRNWMRLQSSARITRSRMMGLANSESSHVLWITSVLWPPRSISEVYSSIARLLSPIKMDTGKYILYFHLFLVLLLVRTVDPCHWDNHPHRVLKLFIEAKGATRHFRCCNGTNRNRKEEDS